LAKDDPLKLTPGSRYRVTSMMTRDEPLTTEGTFKGYTMVGNIDAMILDVAPPRKAKAKGKGKVKGKAEGRAKDGTDGEANEELRIIPAQMIIAIDVLDQAPEKLEKDKTPTSRYYY
jgi:hypothetical protein